MYIVRNASGFVPEPPGIVSEEPEEFDDPGSSLQAGGIVFCNESI